MVEVVAIVEGETEQIFIRDVLAGHLSLHGPIVAERIGLEILRAKCTHFDRWVTKLEQLGSPDP